MRNIKCIACGGEGQFLGSIGFVRHYRCRHCGINLERRARVSRVQVINDRPIVPNDIPQSAGGAVRRGDRKVLMNVWGNLKGYIGNSCVEYPRDRIDAAEWLNGATVRGGVR